MSEEYTQNLKKMRNLLEAISPKLTEKEHKQVLHFIDHDEIGVALHTLAWIIVEENKRIPAKIAQQIEDFCHTIIGEEDFPKNLKNYIES